VIRTAAGGTGFKGPSAGAAAGHTAKTPAQSKAAVKARCPSGFIAERSLFGLPAILQLPCIYRHRIAVVVRPPAKIKTDIPNRMHGALSESDSEISAVLVNRGFLHAGFGYVTAERFFNIPDAFVDVFRGALSDHLDRSVSHIADPAGQPMMSGDSVGGKPETHALHLPEEYDASCNMAHLFNPDDSFNKPLR
jgi:hypothetical protein